MVLPFVTGGSHLSGSLRLNGFAAHRLAYMLDSLVRVSRRVGQVADFHTETTSKSRNTVRSINTILSKSHATAYYDIDQVAQTVPS